MINNNGLIIWPVNTHDVSVRTRRASEDTGVLCGDNPHTNPWAKYKSVRYAGKDTLPQLNADKTWNDDYTVGGVKKPWWKANDGKCGFAINKYSLASQMIAAWDNNWVYQPPRGSTVSPEEFYRITDFNYYDHDAVKFAFVSLVVQETDGENPLQFAKNGVTLGIMMDLRYSEYSLSIMDFKTALFTDFVDFYFGVVIVNANSEYTFKMNPTKFGSSELNPSGAGQWTRLIELDIDYLPSMDGVLSRIYPVLVPDGNWNQTHNSQTTSDFGGTMVPLPSAPLVVKAGNVLAHFSRYFSSYSVQKKYSSGALAGIIPSFVFAMSNEWTNVPINVTGTARFYWLDGKVVTSHDEGEEYLGTDKGSFRIIKLYQHPGNYLEASLNLSITAGSTAQITFSNFSNYYNPPVEFVLEEDGVLDSYPDGIRYAVALPNNLGTYATEPIYIN